MKKSIYILLTLFTVGLLTGCGGGDKPEPKNPAETMLVGEWKLSSWSNATPQDFEVYIAFDATKAFEVYQRIEQISFEKYTGSYLITDTTLSGTYTDQTPWGASYEIEFDTSGNTLTMTSSDNTEVSVYTRTTIPADVKQSTVSPAVSRAGGFRWL